MFGFIFNRAVSEIKDVAKQYRYFQGVFKNVKNATAVAVVGFFSVWIIFVWIVQSPVVSIIFGFVLNFNPTEK